MAWVFTDGSFAQLLTPSETIQTPVDQTNQLVDDFDMKLVRRLYFAILQSRASPLTVHLVHAGKCRSDSRRQRRLPFLGAK